METSKVYKWIKWAGKIPLGAVYAGEDYVIAKMPAPVKDEVIMVPGKFHTTDYKAYIAWEGKEIEVNDDIEILIAGYGTVIEWKKINLAKEDQKGKIAAIFPPFGAIKVNERVIGRVMCPDPENRYTPGYHGLPGRSINTKLFYYTWSGQKTSDEWEVLVTLPEECQFGDEFNERSLHHH